MKSNNEDVNTELSEEIKELKQHKTILQIVVLVYMASNFFVGIWGLKYLNDDNKHIKNMEHKIEILGYEQQNMEKYKTETDKLLLQAATIEIWENRYQQETSETNKE